MKILILTSINALFSLSVTAQTDKAIFLHHTANGGVFFEGNLLISESNYIPDCVIPKNGNADLFLIRTRIGGKFISKKVIL